MNEQTFLEHFASIFDEVELEEITMNTEFKNFEEWSSLTALGLLAVMEEEYEVTLTHNDIKGATLVRDIYEIVKDKTE
ncbi:acyl carrier protein [Riemerella anatipestifer]|uniref:acyl carrier protein n=1 Tax=Riemerella anatipestifer TaxID=34085 RepID=UPI00236488B6|nr:acyl carrier protein [Riemerella anatipestifer]MDD1552699.1 acyl carrier protein [Riemerella anatipestifer]MDY3428151.1 acyl carrier protein [Riemerella anatipestifer]